MTPTFPAVDQAPAGLDWGFGTSSMKLFRIRFNQWAKRTGNDTPCGFRTGSRKGRSLERKRPAKRLGDAPGLSVAQAAKLAGMVAATLSKDIGSGKIKATRIGHRTVRITEEELTRYLKAKGTK
jgi:excisionase family DNA binding protein